jgi:hypothetical protein
MADEKFALYKNGWYRSNNTSREYICETLIGKGKSPYFSSI